MLAPQPPSCAQALTMLLRSVMQRDRWLLLLCLMAPLPWAARAGRRCRSALLPLLP